VLQAQQLELMLMLLLLLERMAFGVNCLPRRQQQQQQQLQQQHCHCPQDLPHCRVVLDLLLTSALLLLLFHDCCWCHPRYLPTVASAMGRQQPLQQHVLPQGPLQRLLKVVAAAAAGVLPVLLLLHLLC
jgi:hypothetical protein